jgi:hypothetical protein
VQKTSPLPSSATWHFDCKFTLARDQSITLPKQYHLPVEGHDCLA